MRPGPAPFIIGIGGTTRDGSSTEQAIRYALAAAEERGARTRIFAGPDLMLPMYSPEVAARTPEATEFVEALRACDGLILGSPAYHGSLSGLVKNALDYVEDLREDERIYLDGRAVGCLTCAYGTQAAGTTLVALRSIIHALRGWPTPLGVTINSNTCRFDASGQPTNDAVCEQLRLMADQVVQFASFAQRQIDSKPAVSRHVAPEALSKSLLSYPVAAHRAPCR